ncbi:MAG: metallophosphoesterase [Candidatus Omnitrophica bacterium]|nr:metallophosphoesterase [Candidatus Omnitrophota bacterium]HOX54141.1 metallophosphoesterase [Candidatus Omnitrophota bacterium]
MKIGLISDTHDNLEKIKKAVKLFNSKKVELVLHAGDFVAPFTINYLDRLNCQYLGVFGNNDGEKQGLTKKSGGKIKEGPIELALGNLKIALVHDINTLASGDFDIVVFGHSHKKELKKEGKTLFVNPGECGGWLTGKSTVAILDTDKLSVKFFNI